MTARGKRKRAELPKPGVSCYGHPVEDVVAAGREIKRLCREYPELDNENLWIEYDKIGGAILGEFLDSVDSHGWRDQFPDDVDLLVLGLVMKRGRTKIFIGTVKDDRQYSLQAYAKYRTQEGSEPELESFEYTDRDIPTDAALDVLVKGTMTQELLQKLAEVKEREIEANKRAIFVHIGS